MNIPLATRMSRMAASAVREILKVTERPDILSFAGGLPAPELFPLNAIAQAHAEVFATDGHAALQYSVTEGYGPLREWLAARMGARGMQTSADRILITNGAQQGIDLAAKILLNPGDLVAIENPSYLAALQTFGGFEAKYLLLDSDDQGMRVDQLESALKTQKPQLIYLVPNFHNPKGTTLSLERRHRLIHLAQTHRIPILEDDPYGELRFQGEFPPSLASLDDSGIVIRLGTFSKTLAPGLRIGWLTGAKDWVRSATIAKQAADLHSNSLSQRAVAKLLEGFDYEGHLTHLRATYGERCRAMMTALKRHMPEGTQWTHPDGGLFLWAKLPGKLNGEDVLQEAIRSKVAFVPGAAFYSDTPQRDFIRLNFSNRSVPFIEEGIQRLGQCVQRQLSS